MIEKHLPLVDAEQSDWAAEIVQQWEEVHKGQRPMTPAKSMMQQDTGVENIPKKFIAVQETLEDTHTLVQEPTRKPLTASAVENDVSTRNTSSG